MPAPGDQHRQQAAVSNPYEEQVPRISEFTATEIATLASRLDKQLGPEYISSRPGAGGQKVHYLAAEKVINLANEVFGFNGWSSQIKNVQVDFCDEHAQTGKIDVGLAIIVRVTLKDGTFHEDMGYGHIENCKGKAAAFEKARKEAATDALKRTLRTFGNVLGNCLYDKEYLSRVTKVKAFPTSKWDPENLHRHHEFAPPKKDNGPQRAVGVPAPARNVQPGTAVVQTGRTNSLGSMDAEDEFGGNLFDEVELAESHSDGVVLQNGRSEPPPPQSKPPQNQQQRPPPQHRNSYGPSAMPPPQTNRAPTAAPLNLNRPQTSYSTPPNSVSNQPQQLPQGHEPPVGFVTGRCAEALTGDNPPPKSLASLQRFNPAAESPSIRKTSGVNHDSSKPVSRDVLNGGADASQANAAANPRQPTNGPVGNNQTTPRNFVNPAADTNRRIGMPQSPMANRGMYKPPGPANNAAAGVKRPPPRTDSPAPGADRAPLSDVSNVVGGGAVPSGVDAKRIRMGEA